MGNSHNKSTLRKAQSVPDTQNLPPDAPVLMKEKSQSQQRLNQTNGKPGKFSKKHKHQPQDLPQLPPAEAVFLPDFPLRGDLENLDFEIIDVIARGAYGNVIKVQREDQKRFYAVKVLDKGQIIQEGAIQQCKDEAAIQSMVGSHPFIVKAHEYWQSRTSLFIVLDYIPHGDMFTLWTFHGAFPERLVQLYIAEMAMVIDYLHNSSVIYRDVKMENILFNAKGHIQLTDFGLAKWLQGGEQTRTVCGTLQYMAPEVLSVYPYGHPADWWSVGILMFAMLAGRYPVDGVDTHTRMAQKVFESDYLLPSDISDEAQDVINRVLTKSPHKRLCDLDFLQDLPFFQDIFFSDLIDQKLNPLEVVPEDFFPMTGNSWAPHLLTSEEQQHFAEFDDSNETITNEPQYPHLPNYRHQPQQQQHHHPDPFPRHHPSKQQPQPQQPQDPRPQPRQQPPDIRAPYGRQQPSRRGQLPQQQVQYDPYSDRRPSVPKDTNNSQTVPPPQSSSMESAGSSGRNSDLTSHPGYTGGNNILFQNSIDRDTDMNGYGTNRSNTSMDRQSSNSSGVAAAMGDGDYNRTAMTNERRTSSGGSTVLAPVGTVYPNASLSVAPKFNNLAAAPVINNNQDNFSLGYKTVDAPPTVTLKSLTMPGLNQASGGYGQSGRGCSSQMNSVTSQGYSSQRYGITNPSSADQRPFGQTPPFTGHSGQSGFKTLDGPPTITLSVNKILQSSEQAPVASSSYSASSNPAGYARRLEEATVRLDSAPQLQAPPQPTPHPLAPHRTPQTQVAQRTPQPQALQNRPVVTVKPIPPQKPTVAAKPSAPVRPIPAPRKSIQGRNHNAQDFTHSLPPGPSFPQNTGNPLYNQRPPYNSNLYSRDQDLMALHNTSMNSNISYNSVDQIRSRANSHPASQGTTMDNSRPRLGSASNTFAGLGYPAPESPTSPTSLENANLKWNLPAGSTPSFV